MISSSTSYRSRERGVAVAEFKIKLFHSLSSLSLVGLNFSLMCTFQCELFRSSNFSTETEFTILSLSRWLLRFGKGRSVNIVALLFVLGDSMSDWVDWESYQNGCKVSATRFFYYSTRHRWIFQFSWSYQCKYVESSTQNVKSC